jgi:hypothetical protein
MAQMLVQLDLEPCLAFAWLMYLGDYPYGAESGNEGDILLDAVKLFNSTGLVPNSCSSNRVQMQVLVTIVLRILPV